MVLSATLGTPSQAEVAPALGRITAPATPFDPPPFLPALLLFLLAGSTSQALTKDRPWLQIHLSTVASGVAILVGCCVLASGMGWELPALPFGH